MNSMTGYGNAGKKDRDFSVEVEIQSYNHRFLDIKVNLPPEYLSLESYIVGKIASRLSRGRINVFVTFRQENGRHSVDINKSLAKKYWMALNRLKRMLSIQSEMNPEILVDLPGVIRLTSSLPSARGFKQCVGSALECALDKMIRMRGKEGVRLRSDLERYLKGLKLNLSKIKKRAAKSFWVKEKPSAKMGRTKTADNAQTKETESRLLEAGAGGNIREELSRLESHISQFENFLDKNKPAGKILEFICREMFREITTMGDKAVDALISRQVIFIKSEIENLREQVRNVE